MPNGSDGKWLQHLLQVRDQRPPRCIVRAFAAGRRHVPLLRRQHALLPPCHLPRQPPPLVAPGRKLAAPLCGAATVAAAAAAVPRGAALQAAVCGDAILGVRLPVLPGRRLCSLQRSGREFAYSTELMLVWCTLCITLTVPPTAPGQGTAARLLPVQGRHSSGDCC